MLKLLNFCLFTDKKNADGQQACDKVLNIANQGNANQNHTEIPPHTCQMTGIKKDANSKCR